MLWYLLSSRYAVVENDNLQYIQLMSTAFSGRSEELLTRVEKALQDRSSQQQLTESGAESDTETEQNSFLPIIHLTRQGEWGSAAQFCAEFAEGQLGRRAARARKRD